MIINDDDFRFIVTLTVVMLMALIMAPIITAINAVSQLGAFIMFFATVIGSHCMGRTLSEQLTNRNKK